MFLLFVVAQSIFVAGAFGAAEGETRKRPDGTDKDGENILYPIKKWLERTVTVRVDYCDVTQFNILYDALVKKYGHAIPPHAKHQNVLAFSDTEVDADTLIKFINVVESTSGVKVDAEKMRSETIITFYIEEERPVFSKYIRKPTLGCPKCMPSLWGILTYWMPVLLFFGFQWWEVLVYIPNVVCCSYCSYLFHKWVE